MPTAVIDGITTRYEVLGSGPPLLMYSPGGPNAAVEQRTTLGVYARIKLLDHLPRKYTVGLFRVEAHNDKTFDWSGAISVNLPEPKEIRS